MSYVVGFVLYWIVGMWLEYNLVPLLITPGKPRLHYIHAFAIMSFGAGLLGLVTARMFRLRRTDKVAASFTGGLFGSLSLLINFWLCHISTPNNYSYLDPSNIVLFGPLVVVSVLLVLWSIMLSLANSKRRRPTD